VLANLKAGLWAGSPLSIFVSFCCLLDTGWNVDGRILLEAFTPEQMQRYEVFRRANLNKSGVKKVHPFITLQTKPHSFPFHIFLPHL
jgi:hypothetical protein